MKKIFTSLVVAVGYLFAADNAAAAISALAATISNDIHLKFNGTALSVSNSSGYSLALLYDDFSINVGLSAWSPPNTSYTEDGFTAGSVSHGDSISSSLNYGNSSFSSLPASSYYGFLYDATPYDEDLTRVYHYGWVNLTYSGGLLTLNSAAINTIAGESILAGQTAVTAVPEPGMWMPSLVLVLGVAFRRRRSRRTAFVV